jgi:DNA-directed RNA polymerase subunit L
MNPRVDIKSDNDELIFTISNINVSLANAIRRTILSDIPLVVFRTTPYEKNKCNIISNTSRLNNEIIKQRLSCIPIHIKENEDLPLKNYIMELDYENNSDIIEYVTTKNFKIKDIINNKYLPDDKTREIFPADDYTGHFIDFIRLRPKLSDELPGEKIHLTCEFDIGTSKEDGMFNAVSTCSYGFTIDDIAQNNELQKKKQTWKDEGKTEDEINFESENWKLLDGKRITKKDSFDFIIKSIGIYTNHELIDKACQILVNKLNEIDTLIEKDELQIEKSQNTMKNCFDIILENEDYTIGKVLEYFLYNKFYETKILSFCGFNKLHPHDSHSIIRVAYIESIEVSTIKGHLKECIDYAKQTFEKIQKEFFKLEK